MDVIMEGEPMDASGGDTEGGTIQIHTQAYVNIIPDELNNDKSIAEKESEVLSLIILNNQMNGNISNVQIDDTGESGASITENLQQPTVVAGTNEALEAVKALEHHEEQLIIEQQQQQQDNILVHQDPAEFLGETMVTMEFHAADAAWITLLDRFELLVNDNRIRGYVEGEKQFICLWESFQSSTMTTFSVRSSDKFYRMATEEDGDVAINGRVLKGKPKWSRTPLVQFDGVPFVSIDRKYFGCRLGGVERQNAKKGQFKTTRNGHSMKVGCPADADILEVWRVPSLTVPDNIKSNREKRRIKKQLLSQVYDCIRNGHFIKRFYVTLPLITKHQNHPVLDIDAGRLKILHPRIIEKIYEIVQQGIREKRVVKYMLDEYVEEIQTELGIEIQESDRSFHPTDRDISNHIRNAVAMVKKQQQQKQQCEDLHEGFVEEDIGGDGGGEGMEVESHQQLSYTTEIVATPSFVEMPPQCDMSGLDINVSTAPSNIIYQQPQNVDSQQTVANFVESAIVDANSMATFNEAAKNFLASHEVTSLEDIVVQDGVLHYYQHHQNDASNMEVPVQVESESPAIVETTEPPTTTTDNTNITNQQTTHHNSEEQHVDVVATVDDGGGGGIVVDVENVTVVENEDEGNLTQLHDLSQDHQYEIATQERYDMSEQQQGVSQQQQHELNQQDIDVSILIEHCKQNPNPPQLAPSARPPPRKKRSRRWTHKQQRSLHKHLDMKTLLKNEIGKSFAIINQALVNEHDETKLKLVLKKTKMLQKIVQGSDSIKRRNRRIGIQSMVDIDHQSSGNL